MQAHVVDDQIKLFAIPKVVLPLCLFAHYLGHYFVWLTDSFLF